jgi:hypothetical protein
VNSELLPDLVNSPVRDVAEDQRVVVVSRPEEIHGPRFRHLAPLLAFASCLGFPVPALLQHRYALFVFYAQPVVLTELTQTQRGDSGGHRAGVAGATPVCAANRRSAPHFALLGQLGRTLVHEVQRASDPLGWVLQAGSKPSVPPSKSRSNSTRRLRSNMPARCVRQIQRLMPAAARAGHDVALFQPYDPDRRRGDRASGGSCRGSSRILREAAVLAWVDISVLPVPHLYFTRVQVTYLPRCWST